MKGTYPIAQGLTIVGMIKKLGPAAEGFRERQCITGAITPSGAQRGVPCGCHFQHDTVELIPRRRAVFAAWVLFRGRMTYSLFREMS